MSIEQMTAVWKLQMPSSHKLVALSLADNANDSGVCWPSVPKICERTCLGERTVQQCLAQLETAGFMHREMRSGRSAIYHLTPAAFAPPQELRPAESAPTPAAVAPPPPQNLRPTPAESAPIIQREPSIESSRESQTALTRDVPRESIVTDDWFLNFKLAYPPRAGDPGWRKASRAANARIAEGHTPAEFIAGAKRYAAYSAAVGNIGTEYVKQAATFLGPDKPFLLPWNAPPNKADKRLAGNLTAAEEFMRRTEVTQ